MTRGHNPPLLALHGLRLKGFTSTESVAQVYGLDVPATEAALAVLAESGYVQFRDGRRTGWALTSDGRAANEEMLAAELDESGQRAEVRKQYEAFLALNPELLAACTHWQLISEGELNDHTDADYDQKVIAELAEIDLKVQPICTALTAAVERFSIHSPRFSLALTKLQAGDADWFTKPIAESYHTIWFELHEDLLATLGIDRASEKAH